MTARVVFTAGFSRRYTDGVREFTVEAKNLRGVIKAMDQLYPSLATISRRKPPSRSTAPSTRPPTSSRSAKAAKSSSSPSWKAASLALSSHAFWISTTYCGETPRSWRLCLS